MTEEVKQLTKAQLRAKRYYESHKQTILDKAKAKRKEKLAIVIPEKVVTYEDIKFVITNNADMKDTTKEIYLKSLKRINNILQYDNYANGLSNIDGTINIIKGASEFSVNTIKLIYQTLLKVIDLLDLKIDKKPYIEQFDLLKIKSTDENKTKQETMVLPTFDKYIKDVQQKFGIESKMYLLAMLYDNMTLRDDYGDLIIVDDIKKITPDVDKNYIFVPTDKKGLCILRINSYKTDKKYGIIHKTLSSPVSLLIKQFIKNNNLNYGDALFGKNVGNYISNKNKEINPNYEGVSWLRHIKVSDLLNKNNVSPEERLALAREMMHSPNVQANYERNKKIIITE